MCKGTSFPPYNGSMQIRPITAADDVAMAAIVRSSLAAQGLDIPGTAYFDPELDHLSTFYQAAGAYFVAIDDDGIVTGGAGFAAFPNQPDVAELQKLYVSPVARHQGLGHQLVALVEQRAAEAGYATLYLETHHNLRDAIHLYRQLGYTQLDGPLPDTTHTTMDLFFSKQLHRTAKQNAADPRATSSYQLPKGFEHCSKLGPVVKAPTALERVRAVVTILVGPGGCPWDKRQTNQSLLKNLLEETYEFVDTVEEDDREGMREELGDLLMQSIYQAAVCAKDQSDPFTLDEVCDRLVDKLITRHPHVFAPDGDPHAGHEDSPEEMLAVWNAMKQREKHRKSVVEGIARAQGAFPRAAKIIHRAAESGHAQLLDQALASADDDASKSAGPDKSAVSASAYANRVLAIIREADANGIDMESALRNRLREVEQRLTALESSAEQR